MVKGYQFKCDYGDGCGMKEYKSHEHLGADYVLATDYAAIEAERDEWKRRCEAMVGELHTAMIHSNPELVSKHMMDALAIAEGRDNG